MKKILLGVVILPLFLVGCKKTTEYTNEIKLSAGVKSVSTKTGPIYSNFSTSFPIGIYAVDSGIGWGLPSNNIINNDQATVLGTTGHQVAFAGGPYYYPVNGDNATFYAFAPNGSESTASTVGTGPKITIPMTGQEDIMWCTASGNKIGSQPANNPVLGFNHKLTQLQFTFKSGTAYPATGYKVTSLLLRAQPTSAVMDVTTGTLTFSGSASMQALSAATIAAGGVNITTAGTNANSPVMTSVSASYTMDVVVTPAGSGSPVTYSNIPITVSAAVASSHMITLTFNETNVAATATVADWTTGSTGSATVQ